MAELPRVDLGDALAVCVAVRQAEPTRFERAALKRIARYCVEHPAATIADERAAAAAFEAMADKPEAALTQLLRLCA